MMYFLSVAAPLAPLLLAAAFFPAGAAEIPAAGTKAPLFTLQSQEGKTVSLKDFGGQWVVLYFYPKDMTPGCTIEAHNFQRDLSQFEAGKAAIVGVSADNADSHREFLEHQKYPFELLVDADKAVCTAYGTKGLLMTTRTVYGIDKTGAIVFAERGMPADAKILAAFDKK